MPRKMNRTWRGVGIVLVLLVAFRVTLPYIVTRHVNQVLNQLEGYRGSIADVDIQLYRGAYQIDSLRIYKINGNQEIPFVSVPLTDLSIEWESLMDGALVGEIRFYKPAVNFIGEKKNEDADVQTGQTHKQAGTEINWASLLRKLLPVEINRLSVDDGTVTFYDLSTDPAVNLFLSYVQVEALNLDNVDENPEPLPSRIYLQAFSTGNGQLNVAMKANVMKPVPDLDMDLRLEAIDLKALSRFFETYASIGVREGRFNLYSEISVTDGKVTGYIKPFFDGLRITTTPENSASNMDLVWQPMAGFMVEIFQRQKRDQYETRVPVEGLITFEKSRIIPGLWNVIGDAFAGMFEQHNTPSITLASVNDPAAQKAPDELPANKIEAEKSKRELRREKRRERKEKRRNRRHEDTNEKADKKPAKDNSLL